MYHLFCNNKKLFLLQRPKENIISCNSSSTKHWQYVSESRFVAHYTPFNAHTHATLLLCIFQGHLHPYRAPIESIQSIQPSVHMKQLEDHCFDFHEILYWRLLWSHQFPLRRNNFNDHFRWSLTCRSADTLSITYCMFIRVKNVSNKSCRGKWITHFMFNTLFKVLQSLSKS
jgi:hypothetical protein